MGVSLIFILFTVFYVLFTNNILDINTLLILSLVGFTLIGVFIILINVPSAAAMMRIVDKDKFGKVTSVSNIGSQGLIPLSMLLGGLAITYMGSVGLLAVCAGGFLIVSLFLFFNKPVREL